MKATAMAPTIHDIAKTAGVGVGTVSRVLNDSPKVSNSTRALVLRVIEEQGYRPKSAAKVLRTRRTHVIGFITDEIATTPYAVNVIRGAQDAAHAQGKVLLLVNTNGNAAVLMQAIETLLERQVEGIIYAAMYHQPVTLPSNIREINTVLVDCYTEARDLPSVVPDEVQGGYDAVSRLIRQGHCRIGFANAAVDIPASRGRLQGYCQALADHQIPFDPDLVCRQDGEADAGYDLTLALMERPVPPTAIFYFNDRMAMGGYDALRKLGKRIPVDVAVMGFDNQEIIAANLHPPLSTMELPHYVMGQWAVTQLLTAADPSVAPVQVKLHCPYIERASV
ncbi:MAG: LacI family DNA-binding transcriptional regulator [Caldilineaceae bacterium]|nr:LacI family DNA-binding transcriptional regulator [Caldilineaceae bacterium]